MNIEIGIKDEQTSYDDIVKLLHSSFSEYNKNDLRFNATKISVNDFINKTKSAYIFVAKAESILVGVHVLHLHVGEHSRCIYGEHLGVAPSHKRRGIARMMLEYEFNFACEMNVDYFMGDTACGATSSVEWHKRMGYKIVGLASFPSTNYYSYVFRKQLKHPSKWDYKLFTSLAFFCSMCKCMATRRKDGKLRWWAKYIKNIKG